MSFYFKREACIYKYINYKLVETLCFHREACNRETADMATWSESLVTERGDGNASKGFAEEEM